MVSNHEKNIIDEIEYISNLYPDKIAIYYNDITISYKKLLELLYSCSNYIKNKNIKKGDKVAIYSSNELEILILFLSLAKLDTTSLVIQNSSNTYQINKLLKETSITKVITNKSILVKDLEKINFNLKAFLTKEIDNKIEKNKSTANFPINITIGSGTTGKSKIMQLSHKNISHRMQTVHEFEKISTDDILTSLAPMDYASTQIRSLSALYKGASVVIVSKKHFDYLNKFKITNLGASVVHIESLLDYLEEDKNFSLDYLKTLILGFSVISSKLRSQIKDKICENLLVGYGANECGAICVSKPPNVYETKGTIGFISKECTIEIVDKNNKTLPKGSIGQLRVKTPAMIDSYLYNEEATDKHFKNGWFYPGDYVKQLEDNQLVYLGRSDDMMNINGINIYPTEIQSVLIELDHVKDCFVSSFEYKQQKRVFAI